MGEHLIRYGGVGSLNIRPVRLDIAAQQDYLYRGSVTIQPRLSNHQITASKIAVSNVGSHIEYYGYGNIQKSVCNSEQTLEYGSYQSSNHGNSIHSSIQRSGYGTL